MALERQ